VTGRRQSQRGGPGERRLRAALARLRAARQAAQAEAGAAPGRSPAPPGPPPESAWEHAAEARLGRIERQLNNQNRLLLFTILSIVADLLIGFARQ
jgi:hypothetical protein